MAETATCHIRADMYEDETEVNAHFLFETTEAAERFFEQLAIAIEEGTIRIGSAEFPPAKTVREVAS